MAKRTYEAGVAQQNRVQTAVPATHQPTTPALTAALERALERDTAVLQRSTDGRLARAGTALLQLQRKHGNHYVRHVVTSTQTRTGLPDNLKGGIESLSGLSLDGVQVHYNSPKPAQLQALAYTQGTEIHVGPGQEKHLPHEAWHVVQQMQGRVEPTIRAKGVAINDDKGLEHEADMMGANVLRMRSPDPVAAVPAVRATPDRKADMENAPVQRITPYFAEQQKRWKMLNSAEGILKMAGNYITTGLEFDIGIMEEGNPLEGIAHLELLTGEHPNNPVPFVMETDAGNTLELATAPYLLETQPYKPFPTPTAINEAISETQAVILKMKKKGLVSTAAKNIGEGLGIEWKPETLNIVPANLSTRANVGKAKLAVQGNNLLESIRVVRDDESIKSPQINILTDAAHLENIEDPGASRLISGPQKQHESKYRKLFDDIIKEMEKALKPLTGNGYKERDPAALRSRIANTIVQQAVAAPLQGKLLEYQGELEKGTLIENRQKAFPVVGNLTSFIKDYSNVWLKTDLITYLRGRLQENTPSLVVELKEKKDNILKKIPLIRPQDLSKDQYIQALLKIAIGENGEKLQTVADIVITTMINELVGPRNDPGKRPALFELNPKLLGARHDTHLSQKQADSVARKLGYVSGRLHLIEIRANNQNTILAGSTRTKIPSENRLTMKHSQALTDITDTVNEYLAQQESLLGKNPFTIEGRIEFDTRIENIITEMKNNISSGEQEAIQIIAIARKRIDELIEEVQ